MGLVSKDRIVRLLGYFKGPDSRYLDGINTAVTVINDCKEVEAIPVFFIRRYVAKYNLDDEEQAFANEIIEAWNMERRKWLYYAAVDQTETDTETGDSDRMV